VEKSVEIVEFSTKKEKVGKKKEKGTALRAYGKRDTPAFPTAPQGLPPPDKRRRPNIKTREKRSTACGP